MPVYTAAQKKAIAKTGFSAIKKSVEEEKELGITQSNILNRLTAQQSSPVPKPTAPFEIGTGTGGGTPISEPTPAQSDFISAPAVPTPETPIAPESVVEGELEKESVFGGQYGVPGMPTSIEDVIQRQKEEQRLRLEAQQKEAEAIRQIEEREFEAEKAKGEASKAGAAATFAPTREGIESAGAPLLVSEFKTRLDARMQNARERVNIAQASRQEALRQMQAAQEIENFALVRQLKAKVDNAALEIKKAETDFLDAQQRSITATIQLSDFGLRKQESIRQNYETFTNVIESGGTFTPQGIVGLSKRLEIPFEDAWNFYEGAQSIRDDKKLTAQEKQIALQEKAFELDQKINGIQTEKAKNLNRYQKMKNMGIFTDLELQDIARGLDLDLAGLPENQAKLALDQANAEIKAIEAKYAGKPPPFGTKDYWDIEEKKAQINKAKAELQESQGEISTPIANAIGTAMDSLKFGSVDAQKKTEKRLKNLIASGDISRAKDFLLSQVQNSVDTESAKMFRGRNAAINNLKAIQTKLDEYVANGGDTGLLTNIAEKGLEKLGRTLDPQLANIATQIRTSVIDYRRAVSGAAFTEPERKEYEAIFPNIGKIPELNKAKISALTEVFERNQNSNLQDIIGKDNFNDIFKPTKSPLDTLTEGLKQYPVETQKKAIEAIRSGQMTLDEALEFYEIPFNQVGGDTEEASQEITQASIGNRKVSGQPKLLSALEQANQDMIASGLGGLKVNESFRENARQAQLYANYIEKPYSYGGKTYQPDPKRKGFRAAKPGQSFHGKGLAVDIRNWKEAEPFLRKYGLRNDLKDDRNHFSIGEFTG